MTVILLLFGSIAFLEPSLELRLAAIAVIGGFAALSLLLVALSNRAARRQPAALCVLTDWGVEFDAPSKRPDLSPPESGGALPWSRVGKMTTTEYWFQRRCGLTMVYFYSAEFQVGSVAITLPREGIWGICVPWIPKAEAARMLALAQAARTSPSAG